MINYKEYLESDYWKGIREEVYKRDGYKCRLCNSEDNLHAHHRTYEFLGNENLDDLITLCRKCHNIFHKKNPEVNYSTHIQHEKWERQREQEEKEVINIWFYLSENRNQFDELLKEKLNKEKHIKSTEFHKIIKKLNTKKFDNILFINICLEYINGISIYSCTPKVKELINFPKRTFGIIVSKDIYNQYPQEFVWLPYGRL